VRKKHINWHVLKEFDLSFKKQFIAGVDEAGRGPLAGPVVSSAVILDYNIDINGLNDSKKLNPNERLNLFIKIINVSIDWSISIVNNDIIDNINILNATFLAMKKAIEKLKIKPDFVLVDGNRKIKNLPLEQKTIVKGDSKSAAIAAASILAKVSRDFIMDYYHTLYPVYLFNKHKGYPTKKHISLIKNNGPSPIHRMSFHPLSTIFNKGLF